MFRSNMIFLLTFYTILDNSFGVSHVASPIKAQKPASKEGACSIGESNSDKESAIKMWISAHLSESKKSDPKSTFEYIKYIGGDLRDLIEIRRQSLGQCRYGYWDFILIFDKKKCRYEVKSGRTYAENCCPEEAACPERSPKAWMLELVRRSEIKDSSGLLDLIDPRLGFKALDQGEGLRTYRRKDGAKAALAIEFQWAPETENLFCPDQFKDGQAECSISRSGWINTFLWQKRKNDVKLLSRIYTDTGE